MGNRPKVKVGDREVELRAPPSVAVRMDVYYAAQSSIPRALAAALGACWSEQTPLGRPRARWRHDALVYGGEVLDELAERGISMAEIMAAGTVALGLCEVKFSDESVREAEGN